jgi:hypothetical protein
MLRNDPNERIYLVDAQAKYYPEFVSIFIPNIPTIKGYSQSSSAPKDMEKELEDKQYEGESPFERSIRRTKRRISDYVLCNDFDMFVTFTFAKDRQNVERSKMKMSNWLRNQRKRNGKFQYLIIPEFHKDGKSLHFHALIGGYMGIIEHAISPRTHQPLRQRGQYVFSLSGYTLGFTNVKVIDKQPSQRYKVGFYVQKYITKDMPRIFAQNRYWASKGLKLPVIVDNPEKFYEVLKPDWEVKTEFGHFMRFNKDSHSQTEILWKE